MTPLLTAIQAPNELGHRLVRGARLHFVVRTLALAAARATEHIGRHALIHLQHLCLALDGHLHIVAPLLGVELRKSHERNIVGLELPLAQTVQQARIADI